MSRRTEEGLVLQRLTQRLIDNISASTSPPKFGDVMCGAGFITKQMAIDVTGISGVSDYTKVSRILSDVSNHITSQHSGEMVTEKFDQFVMLLCDQLALDDLAQQLVQKLGMYLTVQWNLSYTDCETSV